MTKSYSLRIRKHIAALFHILFLGITVYALTVLYLRVDIGSGVSSILATDFEDTVEFTQQIQSDVDDIFLYVAYRDVFETDGELDLSKNIFSVSTDDGPEIIYNLEEVIRLAQENGYYLDEHYHVKSDIIFHDEITTSRTYRINWKAYNPYFSAEGPGASYTSLPELAKEVMDCLSTYYQGRARFIDTPSNLHFHITRIDEEYKKNVYSNTSDMNIDQLKQLGNYFYFSGSTAVIENTFKELPNNFFRNLTEYHISDYDNYEFILAIDTTFPNADVYQYAYMNYHKLQLEVQESVAQLIFGIIGALITLCYLILVSGHLSSTYTTITLHNFDLITTESCILISIILTFFAIFMGEEVGERLLHLIFPEEDWYFLDRMLRAVIIYLCVILTSFSFIRRYKAKTLITNSSFIRVKETISLYFSSRSFSYRNTCFFLCFIIFHLSFSALLYICYTNRQHSYAIVSLFVLVGIIICIDYFVLKKIIFSARQMDQISGAIQHISEGDTSYQMDLAHLTGKERNIAVQLNHIGTTFEGALKEQVKSERLKADLITNVSHDIKTPLTSIINYVDLIKREHIQNKKLEEYLIVLEQKSQRLKNLTEDLVEASKASSGNLKLEMASIDLVEMIWQTNGEFEEKYKERNLNLVSTLPEESFLISADGRRLWRILENLYNNAFKYALTGSRVYVSVEKREETVFFIIKNISDTPLNLDGTDLTERFVRGDVSRSTEGSGLGLSIARSLTHLQNGSFEILIDGDLFKIEIGFPLISPTKKG